MGYKHWKTPKLQNELLAVRKLRSSETRPLMRSDYDRIDVEISSVLKKRKALI